MPRAVSLTTSRHKAHAINRVMMLLEVAGTLTTDDEIRAALAKLTARELHGLHYRIQQSIADAVRETEEHAARLL